MEKVLQIRAYYFSGFLYAKQKQTKKTKTIAIFSR